MAEINARLALPSRCFGIVTAARESPQFDFANSRKTHSTGTKQKLGHRGNEVFARNFGCGGSSELCVEPRYKCTYEEHGTINEKLSLAIKR
jgi:hypothetical protein